MGSDNRKDIRLNVDFMALLGKAQELVHDVHTDAVAPASAESVVHDIDLNNNVYELYVGVRVNEDCENCGGSGRVSYDNNDGMAVEHECSDCHNPDGTIKAIRKIPIVQSKKSKIFQKGDDYMGVIDWISKDNHFETDDYIPEGEPPTEIRFDLRHKYIVTISRII